MTRLSENLIAVGARVMVTIIMLFFMAYVLFVLAITFTLKRATVRVEHDYPLTKPPTT